MIRSATRWAAPAALLWLLCASAQAGDERDRAERVVRTLYPEGLPPSEVEGIGPDGVTRLLEMLVDPAQSAHRANVLLALGMSGDPRAYPALAGWAARPPRGEVDGDEYRARLTLPFALGHLARADERALDALERAARAPARPPGWRHGRQRGEELGRILRRAAVSALALSGSPRATALLAELRAQAAADPDAGATWRQHLDDSRAFHARAVRERRARERGEDPP
jgi:hypothetical protein